MTTTATGAIRISELNTEVDFAAGATTGLSDDRVDSLRASSATPISMSTMYSKTNRRMTNGTGDFENLFNECNGFSDGTIFSGVSGTFGSLETVSANGFNVLALIYELASQSIRLWVGPGTAPAVTAIGLTRKSDGSSKVLSPNFQGYNTAQNASLILFSTTLTLSAVATTNVFIR